MLSQALIRNYKNIKDLSIGFHYAQKKAPNGYADLPTHPFIESVGLRLVPCMALFGPNASGKTSVIQAIASLVLFAQNNPFFHPLRLFQPYLLKELKPQTTCIGLEWTDREQRFCYVAQVAADRIVEETLQVGGMQKFSIHDGEIFLAQADGWEEVEQGMRLQCFDASTQKQMRAALPVIAASFPDFDSAINTAFHSLTTRIIYFDQSIPSGVGVRLLADTFDLPTEEERESAALALISKYLQKLDIRIRRIEKEKPTEPLNPLAPEAQLLLPAFAKDKASPAFSEPEFKTIHQAEDGAEISFSLRMESRGLQKLFNLLSFLLTAVRTGGTVIADDFDAFLHPALMNEIIKLFQVRDCNTKKAQFIFTLHNPELLSPDQLSVSEVAFVSQNGFSGTDIRRLSDFEKERNVNNFRKRYLMGYYGAIPSAFI